MSEHLKHDGVTPDVTVTDTVLVTIKRPQEPGFMYADDGTVLEFMLWANSQHIYPVSGGSSGPGFYQGTFSSEDHMAITRWFADRGHEVQKPHPVGRVFDQQTVSEIWQAGYSVGYRHAGQDTERDREHTHDWLRTGFGMVCTYPGCTRPYPGVCGKVGEIEVDHLPGYMDAHCVLAKDHDGLCKWR